MKSLKRQIIFGIIFVLFTGTISHFAYDLLNQNTFVGFFFPVNESIWEHQKLIFFPMLLYSYYVTKKNNTSHFVSSGFLLGTLVGTFAVSVIFYTYSGILGYNSLILDLLTFLLSVLIAFFIAYITARFCSFANKRKAIKVAIFLVAIAFILFTYFPPNIAWFIPPAS